MSFTTDSSNIREHPVLQTGFFSESREDKKRRFIFLRLALVLVFTAGIFISATPAFASYSISWSPGSVAYNGSATVSWTSSGEAYCVFWIDGVQVGTTDTGWPFVNNAPGWTYGNRTANYQFQMQCRDAGWNWSPVQTATLLVTPTCSSVSYGTSPQPVYDPGQSVASYAYGVSANTTAVSVARWGTINGQNDLVWYGLSNGGGGTWSTSFNLSGEYGDHAFHTYMDSPGGSAFCGATGVTVNQCTAPWGGQVLYGNYVTAFQTALPVGASCVGQQRTCYNTGLSGTYTNISCTSGCSVGGFGNFSSGQTTTGYVSAAPVGAGCSAGTLTCQGSFMGSVVTALQNQASYPNASCTSGCSDGTFGNFANGGTATGYSTNAPVYPTTCASVAATRTCVGVSNSASLGSLNNAGYPYASCTQYYAVTFNANGGSGSMSNQNGYTSALLTSNTFTRAGYTFAGWNTAANGSGTSYANGQSYPFNANVTLYAQWVDQTAPTNPASLSATIGGTNAYGSYRNTTSPSVAYSWPHGADAGSGVNEYELVLTRSSDGTWMYAQYPGYVTSYTLNTSGLVNGMGYHSYIRARDAAGNWAPSHLYAGTFYIDTTAPTVSANNSGSWLSANPTITLSTADSFAGLAWSKYSWDTSDATCRSSGTAFSNGNTISMPSAGSHTLYLCNQDNAGNTGAWNAVYYWDNTAPSAAITAITTPRNTPFGTVSGTASDTLSGLSSATLVIRRGPTGACDGSHADWNGTAWTTACTAGLGPTGIANWSYSSTPSAGLMTDGTYIVYINVSDAVGNSSGWVNQSVVYDATAPTSNTISINAGAANTSNAATTLTLSSTDATSGLSQMQFSCDNSNWSTAEAYGTSKAFNITNGVTGCTATEGTKTVYARFKDVAGNWSSAVSDTIVYDVSAPTSNSISINSGAANTNNAAATLTLSSTDTYSAPTYQMQFSCDNSNWSAWEAYATSKALNITNGVTGCTATQGTKTVYARFRDNLTNTSAAVSDTIVYDVTAPTTSGGITGGTLGLSSWYTTNVTYTLTPADATAGVASTVYCTDTTNTCTPGTAGTSVTVSAESATNYVRWSSTDNAGNAQTVQSSAVIKVDKTAPSSAAPTDDGTSVVSTTLNFSSAPSDALAGLSACYAQIDVNNTDGASLAMGTTDVGTDGDHTFVGSKGNTYYYRYWCLDAAGNSATSTWSDGVYIYADQTALTLTSTSGTYPTAVTLTTSGGSGAGAVTYTAANGTATGCSIAGSTLNYTSAGTCSVRAYKAGDASYNATSSATTTVTIAKGTQATLTLTSTSGTYPTGVSLTYTGGSGAGAVTYTAANGTATGCSIAGSTLNYTTAGTCSVAVRKAGDTNYNDASSATTTVTIASASQAALTITSTSGTYPTSVNLTTSGGSGTGAVSYTVATGTATGCSMSATTTLSYTSAGTCLVRAHKAADANYSATSSATTTVTIAKGTQVGFLVTNTTGTYPTGFNLATAGGSGAGAVTYALVAAGTAGCSVSSGGAVTFTATGTCTVNATKDADTNYNATTSPNATVTIGTVANACTGGTVTQSGGYTYHTFYGNGTLTCSSATTADVLIVGGGGGGGSGSGGYGAGGGGGAGGVVIANGKALSATNYSVTVGGAGGAGGVGGNSTFDTGVAKGGGYGGRYGSPYNIAGGSGGAGPGNPYGAQGGSAAQQPTGISGANNYGGTGYGNAGGAGGSGSGFCNNGGGGGGGAGGAGGTPPNYYNVGTPGTGLSVWGGYITVGYGGGGGPTSGSSPGTTYSSNYGSGGGGGGFEDDCSTPGVPGNGGVQGIVIVRYPTPVPPTVTTPTVTAVGITGATLGGTITSNGGSAIINRGTCWGTSPSPSTNCTHEGGTSVAAFSHARTGLSAGTLYYARAYADTGYGRGYSADTTFTTQSVPTLASPTVSGVGSTTATMGATLSTNGSTTITARGTCWGTSSSPTGNCLAEGGTSLGAYTHVQSGLAMNTLHYIRGYADYTDGAGQTGRAYSSDISTTTNGVPTVGSPTVASVGASQVTAGGNVTATNGSPVTARGTCYGTSPSPTGSCTAEGGTSTGVFTHARTGLQPNTLYYFRAYADNAYGRGYSADISTTTLPVPYLVSAGDQFFDFGQGPAPISTITITDPSGEITASNDIRIAIATSTVDMRWVISDTAANFGGTAAAKVSNPVSYENGGSVLVIPVDVNFTAGNTLTVSGLSFANFNTVNPPVPALSLRIQGAGSSAVSAVDTKTVAIRPTLGYTEHTRGQVNDRFNAPTVTNEVLFAFKFVPGGEAITVGPVAIQLADVTGIGPADISNVALYRDVNNNREYDSGTDIQVGGTAVVTLGATKTGNITFPDTFPAAGPADYILVGTVTNLSGDDRMFISLGIGNLTTTGATAGTVSGTGSLRGVLHVLTNKGGNTGGGGGITTTAIGGAGTTSTTTITTGGGAGTGGTSGFVDPNSGTPIGNEPGFFPPSGDGNPYSGWTNGPGGRMSDGSYTMTNTNGAQQSYAFTLDPIPTTNTIDGVAVKLEGFSGTADQTITVKLSWDGGTSVTTQKVTPALTGVDGVYYLGSPSDKWGRTWTADEFNSGNFRVELTANTSGGGTVNVDAIQVKVFHRSTGGSKKGGGAVFTWPDSQYANVYSALGEVLRNLQETILQWRTQ